MIGMIGINHTAGNLAARERVAHLLSSIHEQRTCAPGVLLLTCNRAEWYFASSCPDETSRGLLALFPAELASGMYALVGLDCFLHLSRVTAGLDSLFVGESEIQGQVRAAYETARTQDVLPREIHILFQKALRMGKILRKASGQPPQLGEEVARVVIRAKTPSLLLVGASAINRRIAAHLRGQPIQITITNRTALHAESFAHDIGATTLPWERLDGVWWQFPSIITAARATDHLITATQRPPVLPHLMIDLGVPRNIDPMLATHNNPILNIDDFTPRSSPDDLLVRRTTSEYSRVVAPSRDPPWTPSPAVAQLAS